MSLISRIIKQCRSTFEPKNKAAYQKNLSLLQQLVSQLSYSELKLPQSLVARQAFADPNKAPCTFIALFESELFTLTIFILRSNYSMPLHDHPGITGILKMLYGSAQIQSFTRTEHSEDLPLLSVGSRFKVNVEPQVVIDPESEPAILTPHLGNFHEISNVGAVPCAFLDVLSPCYGDAERECSYFRKLTVENQLFLEKIPAPHSYYCDSLYYPLPKDCETLETSKGY